MTKQDIALIFDKNKGVATAKALFGSGVTHYQINQLVASGYVLKLKHGVYKWHTAEENEWADISHIVPIGVLCSLTAALHYELTTFVSSDYHIAIPKKAKIVLPAYPPIQLYYWENQSFHLGITEVKLQDTPTKMYDIEKTVCDVLRLRNKIGMDITKEVLKNYLQRSNRNIALLNDYARQLRIFSVLNDFLTILL